MRKAEDVTTHPRFSEFYPKMRDDIRFLKDTSLRVCVLRDLSESSRPDVAAYALPLLSELRSLRTAARLRALEVVEAMFDSTDPAEATDAVTS